MAISTWARRGGAPRFPRQLVIMTDDRQDEDLRDFALATNRSISDVTRAAISAGLPILRKRALREGTLPEVA